MDARYKDLGFDEIGRGFTLLDGTVKAEGDLLECSAFSRLHDIAMGVDWQEFKIDPANTVFGEGCTWSSFCNKVGELGVVINADPELVKSQADFYDNETDAWKTRMAANGDVCRWLHMVENEYQVERLRRLLSEYSNMGSWSTLWNWRKDLDKLVQIRSLREQGNQSQAMKLSGTLRGPDCSSDSDSSLQVRIAGAAALVKHYEYEQRTITYLMQRFHPDQLHVLPVVDFTLPSPPKSELLNYAEQCKRLEESLRPTAQPQTPSSNSANREPNRSTSGEVAGKLPPEQQDKPAFFGLTVDEVNKTVERTVDGKVHRIFLERTPIEWHTFLVAFKAGENGATRDQWMNGYPGEIVGGGPKTAKQRLKEKLQPLRITLAIGSGVTLIEWDGNS